MSSRSDLSNNQTIREAIRKIALHGVANPVTGAIRDAARIAGYVAKIHTEGDLTGTVDVQEFAHFSMEKDDNTGIGYHEGVFLSAIQDNSRGMVVIPKLYSEVIIVTDPETGVEYVSMFSHVDIIQLDSYEKVIVGVTEREEYKVDDENAPDIEDLEETGAFSRTTYTKESVISEVQGKDDSDKVKQTIDNKKLQVVVGDDKSSQLIDKDKIQLKHNKAESILGEDSNTVRHGSSSVIAKDGTVYLGSESGTDDAVLGSELANILMDMLDYMSQMTTTTQLGPQPPLNMARFIALKAEIGLFKSSHSGFLTKKVQVQK
ncbi:MAG: hypothetical protein LBK58_15925 [Prevotellaceae bacterium]|jgi:hypothetical protein|nr:hypothetical protein [Prevotellaceae bacterium]